VLGLSPSPFIPRGDRHQLQPLHLRDEGRMEHPPRITVADETQTRHSHHPKRVANSEWRVVNGGRQKDASMFAQVADEGKEHSANGLCLSQKFIQPLCREIA